MQQTSAEAWKDFKDSPSRTNCMRVIVYTLKQNGPLTGREICDRAGQEGLWKRLSEMEKLRMVKTIGKRLCTVSGKKALVWALFECDEELEPAVETNNIFEDKPSTDIDIPSPQMDRLREALEKVNQHL